MNLSNYLQMPPAPSVPQPAQSAPTKGASSVVGLDSAGNLKLDFAQIMARQFEQMPQLKRQDLAAASRLAKLDPASQDMDERQANSSSSSAQDRFVPSDRLNTRPHSAEVLNKSKIPAPAATQADRKDEDDPHHSQRADDDKTVQASDASHASNPSKAADETMPVAALEMLQAAWIQAPVATTADAPLADSAASPTLKTVALSEQTKLITDPRHAPSPQSLMAFAQSMGMDPEAIGQLMGHADAANLSANPAVAQAPTDAPTPGQLAAHLGQTLGAHQGASQLQASLSAAMQAHGMGSQSGEAAAMLTSMSATHIQAHSVGTPSQAVNLPGAAMSTLQMLTPADPNAAMQNMMQVGMLPVAPAMTSTASVTDFDLITLHSADLSESQIGALAGLLAESGAADGSDLSQDQQSAADGQGGSFAQALAAKTNSADAANRPNAQGVNRPMSEVYERLSEKLSTEMAARMHEQINAGQWKMKFGLRPAHLGGVEIQLEMKDGKLSAQLNADNPMTREMLQNSTPRLREALANLGVQTDQVTVGQNQSGFAHTGSQGRDSGNPPQVGDNLSASVTPTNTAPERGNGTSSTGSDSLLDLYA